MARRRSRTGTILLAGLLLVAAPSVRGQSAGGSGTNSGLGLVPMTGVGGSPGGFGVLAVPMMPGTTAPGGSSATGVSADPLGVNAVYGPALPMTNGQAGLLLLSTQQRMLGLGNGQLSGSRPGVSPDARVGAGARSQLGKHPVEAHTRNSNIPGGQASRFFNRGGLAAERSRPFYRRQLRYFPQTGK